MSRRFHSESHCCLKKMEQYFPSVLKGFVRTDIESETESIHKTEEEKEMFTLEEVEMEKEKLTEQFQTDVKNLSDAAGKIVALLREVITKLETKNHKLEQRVNDLEERLKDRTVSKILDDQVIVNLKNEIEDLKKDNNELTSVQHHQLSNIVNELVVFASSYGAQWVNYALAYGYGLRNKYLWF